MVFTYYTTSKEFADDVSETLKQHEIQNNMLFHNINDNPNKVMASIKDDKGNLLLTAIRTVPFPMVMYETDNIRNDEAVKFFADSLVRHMIDIDFIMTEKALAKSFCDYYARLAGKSFYSNESLVLYVADTPPCGLLTDIAGSFRKAEERDMYYLPYWAADFAPACNIGDYNLEHGIKKAESAIKNNRLYIWEDEYPVSMAAMVRQTSGCKFIGEVYTPPTLRAKGYSTACVGNLMKKIFNDGYKYCALYANCDNLYSNKVYRKLGFKEVFWYDQYKLYKG